MNRWYQALTKCQPFFISRRRFQRKFHFLIDSFSSIPLVFSAEFFVFPNFSTKLLPLFQNGYPAFFSAYFAL